MDLPTTLDVVGESFTVMVRELSFLSGKPFEGVLLDQAATVLRNCLKHTAAASVASVVKRASKAFNHVEFEDGRIISFWKKADATMFLDVRCFKPRAGDPVPRTFKNGMVWHNTAHRMPDPIWVNYQAHEDATRTKGFKRGLKKKRAADLQTAKDAIGTAKQSWLQAAQDLGLDAAAIAAPGYVANARPSTGQTYKNGTARRIFEQVAAYIDLRNDNPLLTHFHRPSGEEIMAASIAARVTAFDDDVARGVFEDFAARAKRYPGIFTDTTAAPSS